MSVSDRLDELAFDAQDRAIVDQVFGAGRMHPLSDELIDEVMDLLDRAALRYLKAKRDSRVVEMLSPELHILLDKVILERYKSLCNADREIHESPPYYTGDRWPRSQVPTVKKIIAWAFGNCEQPQG